MLTKIPIPMFTIHLLRHRLARRLVCSWLNQILECNVHYLLPSLQVEMSPLAEETSASETMSS
jgi:hypothetical protein